MIEVTELQMQSLETPFIDTTLRNNTLFLECRKLLAAAATGPLAVIGESRPTLPLGDRHRGNWKRFRTRSLSRPREGSGC
jgi:hypothetical protein